MRETLINERRATFEHRCACSSGFLNRLKSVSPKSDQSFSTSIMEQADDQDDSHCDTEDNCKGKIPGLAEPYYHANYYTIKDPFIS